MPVPPLLTVIVPTLNEAGTVTALRKQLGEALTGVDFEICFVDDSDDTTVDALIALEAADPDRVQCIFRHGSERRGGLATAVVTGLRLARGRYVCVMDADLQHPPETIRAMLAAAESGADLVVASRYLRGGTWRGLGGRFRRAVSRVATSVVRALFSEARKSTDPLAGFFLCRRELIAGIEFRPVGFKVLLEMLVCVPRLRVTDVPFDFAPRAAGASKASARQGLLFIRHLASLFFEVEGSARFWKFATVGVSGLVIFEALLFAAVDVARVDPLAAFFIGFIPAMAWNAAVNRRWTFADVRRRLGNSDWMRYLERSLLAGAVMLLLFIVLTHPGGIDPLLAGLVSALIAMALNGAANYRATRRRSLLWSDISLDRDITRELDRLAEHTGAQRAYMLPPHNAADRDEIPSALLERAVARRQAAVWTEDASHRAQRRTNIDVTSIMLVPIVMGDAVVGVVVLERRAADGFSTDAQRHAVAALEGLAPLLARAATNADPMALRAAQDTAAATRP